VSVSPTTGRALAPETLVALERLAAIERTPGSEGERIAAMLLAEELARRGARVSVDAERVHGTYWVPVGLCSLAAALAAGAGRRTGAAVGLAAALSIADDLDIGRRPLRRVLPQRIAHNVLADLPAEVADGRTLVIHAHHDATRTGVVFHPAIAKLAARLGGRLIERVGATPAPLWAAVYGPAAVCGGALLGLRWLQRAGAALSAGFAAAMANIALSRPVPGANDNLSGVCVLLELAAALSRRPAKRLRVLLLSTGSEESFLEAMVRFGERHFSELRSDKTTFLCIESVGSPQLMLLAGEGLLRLRRYPARLIDTLTDLAPASGARLRSPFRYRMATDGQVPLLAGYPAAVISSMDWYKAPSNYHWPTDRPENLDRVSVASAARLAEAFVWHLDAEPLSDRPGRP
jgi:hypothetical protein